MTLEELRNSLEAVNQELETKRASMEGCTDIAQIENYRKEADALIEKRGNINGQIEALTRAEAEKVFEQTKKEENPSERKETTKMNRREALALVIGSQYKRTALSEEQQRAVGTALSTTATTYVAPTASVDGVNNMGVLVPTQAIFDLLNEEGKMRPILRDIVLANIPGMTTFPYRKARSTASKKTEGAKGADASWEFATLVGVKGYIQTTLEVTEEVLCLSAIEVGTYVLNQILADMMDDFSYYLVYGDGSTTVSGILNGATSKTLTASTIADDMISAVSALPQAYANGAKVYCSRSVYNALAGAKDTAGHYIFNPFGVNAQMMVLGCPVELDDTLTAGDVVIGNVAKYFKGNLLKDITLEKDKDIAKQITTFVGSAFACTAPVPGAFIKATL